MSSISIAAEEVFKIGNFSVTNSLLTTWVGIVLIILLVALAMRGKKMIPSGGQLILETLYLFFLNLCENVLGEKKTAEKAVPFIASIFIFVFAGNIFEIIPGVGSIGFFEQEKFTPLFRPGSADLNMTIALALISVIMIQAVGFKTLGIGYIKKFINFSHPIKFFVGILETISEIAKIISFSFRLFGNIFAGEVLLSVMLMLMPYFVPLPFYGLELFVAVIQAFVFAMLTLVFMKVAMIPHGGENH
ncbi:MAG: F0F1 ATP synthase subunit A [Patescibacteria group bacterium]|mgnify:CR=1 FL=1